MNYSDFDVEIGTGAGRDYPVVVRCAAGEARETMRFPFDELQVERALDKLQIALLRSGGRRRKVLSAEEQPVRDFGRALFEALLGREGLTLYRCVQADAEREGKGLRLRLRILDAPLAALPWEYLWDRADGEYLVLSTHTPVVRYLELPRRRAPLAVVPPLRILGMVSSPADLPPLDEARERARVENAIAGLREQGLVELEWLEGQRWSDVQRAMRRGPWHIFHFIGHGGYDAARDEGLIVLADERGYSHRFHATELGRLLSDHRSLRLVLLNACEGARGGERDLFASVAATLVQRGVPAVVAMQHEISEGAALELARAFYEALADGYPVDAALAVARKAISFAVANSVEWGTPVLFMRTPDGVLFDISTASPSPRSRPRPEPDHEPPPEPAMSAEQLALLVAMREPDRSPKERVDRGRRLAEIGDPRAEVMSVARMALCYVPAGPFVMGSVTEEREERYDPDAWPHEWPEREYYIPYPYWIGKYAVTNAQYGEFVAAGCYAESAYWSEAKAVGVWKDGFIVREQDVMNQKAHDITPRNRPVYYEASYNFPNNPVVGVTWYEALAFTRWMATKGRQVWEVLLPSEPEWEKAARGGVDLLSAKIVWAWSEFGGGNEWSWSLPVPTMPNPEPARRYPWQGDLVPNLANYGETGIGTPSAAGCFPWAASPYGPEEMVGTVWEWSRSIWRESGNPYPTTVDALKEAESVTLDSNSARVLRGGGFGSSRKLARVACRFKCAQAHAVRDVGFRVVVRAASPHASDIFCRVGAL